MGYNYLPHIREHIEEAKAALDKLDKVITFLESVGEEVSQEYDDGWHSGQPPIKLEVSSETFDMIPGFTTFDYMKQVSSAYLLRSIYFIDVEEKRKQLNRQ